MVQSGNKNDFQFCQLEKLQSVLFFGAIEGENALIFMKLDPEDIGFPTSPELIPIGSIFGWVIFTNPFNRNIVVCAAKINLSFSSIFLFILLRASTSSHVTANVTISDQYVQEIDCMTIPKNVETSTHDTSSNWNGN